MRRRFLLIALCFGPTVVGCRTAPHAEGPTPVVVSAIPPPPDAPAAWSERTGTPPSPGHVDLKAGREVFKRNCAPCHGAQGQGLIGPNLTDRCYKHGHRRADLERVIVEGVPDKGMVAWKLVLSGDQIEDVTDYVESIGGQNVPGKPCDGSESTQLHPHHRLRANRPATLEHPRDSTAQLMDSVSSCLVRGRK